MPDWPFFGYIRCYVFAEGSNSADLSDRLANLIMISVEHCKNDEILFQNVCKSKGAKIAHYILFFVTFCFMGTLARRMKT